jgi:hypothetical protein
VTISAADAARIAEAVQEGLERAAATDARENSGPRKWSPPTRPPFAPPECKLPPVDYELDWAAEALTALLVDDSVEALVSACRCVDVREAVVRLLEALAKVRGR